ncbi:glycosyltransferase family 4 protein [Vibrio vulnificus]
MKALFVGPASTPITGQSLVFDIACKNYQGDKHVVYTTGNGFYYPFVYLLKIVIYLFRNDYELIYFTSSRSRFGFLRDLPLLLFCLAKPSVKLVNHLHGADVNFFLDSLTPVERMLVLKCYGAITTSIVLSEGMKEQYSQWQNMNTVVLKNPYVEPVETISVIEKAKDFRNGGEIKVLFLSNLIKEKGLIELLTAIKSVKNLGINISLDIAGASFDNDVYREVSKDLDAKYITFHGVVSGRDKIRLLGECNVIALPSYYVTEAQPMCLLEGMAAGAIALSTIHNYIPEFLPEETGLLVEKRSTEALVSALKHIDSNRHHFTKVMMYNSDFVKREHSLYRFKDGLNKILRV